MPDKGFGSYIAHIADETSSTMRAIPLILSRAEDKNVRGNLARRAKRRERLESSRQPFAPFSRMMLSAGHQHWFTKNLDVRRLATSLP
jgi:hypothetical protein